MSQIKASELILNPDGSVYHLHLKPGQVAEDIITVGDIDRVDVITRYFDEIEFSVQNREFKTSTGTLNGKRITVISTGIGTDNIDIVMAELDALFNIDLVNRVPYENLKSLNIYRIGTSGALRSEIALNSFVASAYAIGLDSLLHFYKVNYTEDEKDIIALAASVIKDELPDVHPYAVKGSEKLLDLFKEDCLSGITITNTGFYGPQGRALRIHPRSASFLDNLRNVSFKGVNTTNLEMETAGIYGMAKVYGHHAISLNAIIANREARTFSDDTSIPVLRLIELALSKITSGGG
jgi:uridine phosphorylase